MPKQLGAAVLALVVGLSACQREGADPQGAADLGLDGAAPAEDAAGVADLTDGVPDSCPQTACGDCADVCNVLALGGDGGVLPIMGLGALPPKVVSERHGAARRDASGGIEFFPDPQQRPVYDLIVQGCAGQTGPLPTLWRRVNWTGDGNGMIVLSLSSGDVPVPGVTWGTYTKGTPLSPADMSELGLMPNGAGAGYLELVFSWVPANEKMMSSVLQSFAVSYECPEGGG